MFNGINIKRKINITKGLLKDSVNFFFSIKRKMLFRYLFIDKIMPLYAYAKL